MTIPYYMQTWEFIPCHIWKFIRWVPPFYPPQRKIMEVDGWRKMSWSPPSLPLDIWRETTANGGQPLMDWYLIGLRIFIIQKNGFHIAWNSHEPDIPQWLVINQLHAHTILAELTHIKLGFESREGFETIFICRMPYGLGHVACKNCSDQSNYPNLTFPLEEQIFILKNWTF